MHQERLSQVEGGENHGKHIGMDSSPKPLINTDLHTTTHVLCGFGKSLLAKATVSWVKRLRPSVLIRKFWKYAVQSGNDYFKLTACARNGVKLWVYFGIFCVTVGVGHL